MPVDGADARLLNQEFLVSECFVAGDMHTCLTMMLATLQIIASKKQIEAKYAQAKEAVVRYFLCSYSFSYCRSAFFHWRSCSLTCKCELGRFCWCFAAQQQCAEGDSTSWYLGGAGSMDVAS